MASWQMVTWLLPGFSVQGTHSSANWANVCLVATCTPSSALSPGVSEHTLSCFQVQPGRILNSGFTPHIRVFFAEKECFLQPSPQGPSHLSYCLPGVLWMLGHFTHSTGHNAPACRNTARPDPCQMQSNGVHLKGFQVSYCFDTCLRWGKWTPQCFGWLTSIMIKVTAQSYY